MPRRARLQLALIALLLTFGCVENPPLPFLPYDRPLVAVAVDPPVDQGPVARNPLITLSFNTYLAPGPLTYYNTLGLRSGGIRANGITEYRMVDKALVWRTTRSMRPDLYYTLTIQKDVLFTVTGQPYQGVEQLQYLAGDFSAAIPPAEPAPVWEDVAPIFEPCGACHDDPEWRLPAMTWEGLVNQPSAQQDKLMVRPFDPPGSYLLHKLLDDYPDREGTSQPPAWAGLDHLDLEDLRLIEAWIAGGAQRERIVEDGP